MFVVFSLSDTVSSGWSELIGLSVKLLLDKTSPPSSLIGFSLLEKLDVVPTEASGILGLSL